MKSFELKLRRTLKINAVFTFVSSFLLITFPSTIANIMSIESNMILQYIGVGLGLFFLLLVYNSTKKILSIKQMKFIVYQDFAWVTGSFVLLALHLFEISLIGSILIAVVAIIVGIFGYIQHILITKIRELSS